MGKTNLFPRLFLLLILVAATVAVAWERTSAQTVPLATNACGLSVSVSGSGSVNVTQGSLASSLAMADAELKVEIGVDNSYVLLENSQILVRYQPYQSVRDGVVVDEFSIVNFRLKSAGNTDLAGGKYLDSPARRGALKSAQIIYDKADRKTIRLVWNNLENNSVPGTKEIIEEVSIYPNTRFLKLDYINNQWGLNITDLGRPGGTVKGVHLAYGGEDWVRGYITHQEELETLKGSYYNRHPKDGVNDPADGGSLNYNDHFIIGVYNPSNGIGYGRVMPIKDTHIVKLLLTPTERRGMEFFPYPFYQPHPQFTGYLYGFTGGADDLIASGKALADGSLGQTPYPCNQPVTLQANADNGWAFSNWAGDLSGNANPETLLITGSHYVQAVFKDTKSPSVTDRDPAPNEKDVATDRAISLHIKDDGTGVNQGTVKLTVNGQNVTAQTTISGNPNDLTLSYTPGGGLPFNANVEVKVEACDLASPANCMAPVTYSFATETSETVPPEIADVKVVAGVDFATITWKTNEPATSQVDFGPTNAYGNMVVNEELRTDHSVTLKDVAQSLPGPDALAPNAEYHFKITSADQFGNATSTADAVLTTQESVAVASDDFNTCSVLDPMWQFVNPVGDGRYELDGSRANLEVPAGVAHDAWIPLNKTPRLMQAATAFDQLQVKFESGTSDEGQMQGVFIEQDAENYLRINFQRQGGTNRLFVIGFETGKSPKIIRNVGLPSSYDAGPVFLKVRRNADLYNVYYSKDGVNFGNTGTFFGKPLAVTQVGVFVGNTANTPGSEPAHTAEVDYFFNTDALVDPEDPVANYLPVSVEGQGSVTKIPTCGNPVQLLAVPDEGWLFSHWTGSPLNGRTEQVLITPFSEGDAVTAHFVPDEDTEFTLQVNLNPPDGSGGSVARQPDQPTYEPGTNVTLTAQPQPGWSFAGWGGALSGTNPVANLLMNQDKTVSATFVADNYTLTINVVGQGTVTRAPSGPYKYFDQVVLTAQPQTGWSFAHWSGDLSGTQNPATLFMQGNRTVTANFVAGKPEYKLYTPMVTGS